ncbi:MAG: hypothetical protein HYX94_12085 [Chloroflexi bacterium]|nr:hypothetical protein [Chloroflexota bacterium]
MRSAVGLSPDMSSFMFTFLPHDKRQLVLLGHPPLRVIEQALTLPQAPEKLLIDQEEMHEEPKTYDLWPFQGELRRYPITMPVAEALRKPGAIVPKPTFPPVGVPQGDR